LPGVERVEVDLDSDRLQLSYDPQKVDPNSMIATIRKEEFEAEIVTE
jgi:copper chaperone CopZ